jgi:UDP-N-acetylglucosamine:LPS N-acetylglucosamine transferase
MGGPRVLYASSALGLGHMSKDLAIVNELRLLRPDVEVLWLTGHPASDSLAEVGERVLPEAEEWRGGTVIAERAVRDGQLDLMRYVYSSFPAWAHNARLFRRVIDKYDVDIAMGDETWEISIPISLRLLRPRVPFVLLLDFVGTDSLTGRPLNQFKSYVLNVVWSRDAKAFSRGPYSEIFIGDIEDIPDVPLGWGLPGRREHARANYVVVGHIVRFRPGEYRDRAGVRARLGYDERPLVICSVGGTAVGRELLELCGRSFLPLRERIPDVRMRLVCGPRLPVESVRVPDGVEVLGYVPELFEHHACCDVAVGQCGASSTTELAALGTPFIYFPIDGHFEQELVAARLARHGVGVRMSLSATSPVMLADEIARLCGCRGTYPTIPAEGARNAARHVVKVLEDHVG